MREMLLFGGFESPSQIRHWIVLGPSGDDSISEYLAASLSRFLELIQDTAFLHLLKHRKHVHGFDIGNRLSTDIRENIFSQIFENVVSITGRPIRFLMFMPFKCKRLKTVIHREYSGLLLRLLDLRRQYREPFGLTSRYRPPPSASL